jgi:glycosyltransferase involved in cell wall biosynthesis
MRFYMNRPEGKTARDNAGPAVSVIIPVYNGIQYVSEAIESVLDQVFTDYEIIVINDGSPHTEDLERKLDPFRGDIRYLKQENRGPGGARNTGILAARGNFIAFLDADDYWLPDFLSEQLSFIYRNPAIDLVYADAILIGDSPLAGKTFMQTTPTEGEVTLESLLDERCTVVLSGVVARRQKIIDAGLFDERFRYAEDYDLWLRLIKYGARLSYQRKTLLCRRMHKESLCENATTLFENALRVLEKAGRCDDLTEDEQAALIEHEYRLVAYLRLERGKDCLMRGEFAKAAELIGGANRFYRSWKLTFVLIGLRLWPNLLLRLYSSLRKAPLKPESVSESMVIRSYE